MKMIGKLHVRCNYGCCRVMPQHKQKENRSRKRGKRENLWKKETE